MKIRKKRLFIWIYVIFDIVAVVFGGVFAMILRFGFDWQELSLSHYAMLLIATVIFNIFIMYFNKLYDLRYMTWVAQFPLIFNSFMYTITILGFTLFFIRTVSFSRLTYLYFIILTIFFLSIFRYFSNNIVKSLLIKGIGTSNLLIIGITDRIYHIFKYLKQHPEFGYRMLGFIEKKKMSFKGLKYLGNISNFQRIINENIVDAVLIDSDDKEQIKEIVSFCEENYIQAYMIPDILDITSNPVDIGQISTIPLIKFKEGFIIGRRWKLKRLFDIIISSASLLLLMPLFIIISILIKIDSKGPIFFKHKRMGLNCEEIEVYKFRTMIHGAENLLLQMFKENPELEKEFKNEYKLKKDPRVTRVGRILRKTSIDELPQLINVLKGEMSIVGPRPIVKDELEKYAKYAKLILKVPPGITGMWQMGGRSDVSYKERIRLDMYYINNWTFWLDIMIILKTIPSVLSRRGAY